MRGQSQISAAMGSLVAVAAMWAAAVALASAAAVVPPEVRSDAGRPLEAASTAPRQTGGQGRHPDSAVGLTLRGRVAVRRRAQARSGVPAAAVREEAEAREAEEMRQAEEAPAQGNPKAPAPPCGLPLARGRAQALARQPVRPRRWQAGGIRPKAASASAGTSRSAQGFAGVRPQRGRIKGGETAANIAERPADARNDSPDAVGRRARPVLAVCVAGARSARTGRPGRGLLRATARLGPSRCPIGVPVPNLCGLWLLRVWRINR